MIPEEFITVKELSSGTIYKRKDGILILRQAPERKTVNLKEIKEQQKVFLEIQKGERSPLLVVIAHLQYLDNEEKMFLNSTVAEFASKMCIVTNSPIPIFMFNILFFLFRPRIPSKIVKTEKEGFAWLAQNKD